MKNEAYYMDYDNLHYHIGHKIVINDVWDWATNRESGIEIRCANKECECCEPILEMDNPDWIKEFGNTKCTDKEWSTNCAGCKYCKRELDQD